MSGARRAAVLPARRAAVAGSALLVAAGLAGALWASLTAFDAIPMCGGPMPGRGWPGETASVLAMWVPMMAAMMLPSVAPRLARWGGAAMLGYAAVWTLAGLPASALAAALAAAPPDVFGAAVLVAGAFQLSPWKARLLARCRRPDGGGWRQGLRLGVQCVASCAGLTTVLLAVGMMDLGAMAAVTAAITAERLAPAGARVARAVGVVIVAMGLAMVAGGHPAGGSP